MIRKPPDQGALNKKLAREARFRIALRVWLYGGCRGPRPEPEPLLDDEPLEPQHGAN